MSKFRNINELTYSANLYGEDPCEILTAFETMEYQRQDPNRELDFQEVLDYEANNPQEVIMTAIVEQQKQDFEDFFDKLNKVQNKKELSAVCKEYFAAQEVMDRQYMFTPEDKDEFWAKYNSLKAFYQAEWEAEQNAKRQTILDEHINNIKTAEDFNQLQEIRVEFKRMREDSEKLKYLFGKQVNSFWDAYNTKKDAFLEEIRKGA